MTEKLQDPFVTCEFKGQIGNQLFIVATTLSYAWDHRITPLFPGLNTQMNRTSYNKNRLFFRLNDSDLPRPIRYEFNEKSWYAWEKIPAISDLKLNGYFQSWKYFDHHRDKILSIFAPSTFTLNILHEKYEDLIANPNTVAIHVRTAGKHEHQTRLQPFLGLEYYRKVMALFPPESVFVIFSDRINWCKIHFPSLGKNFIFIDDNYGIEDLFLMSMMRDNIIANSSFSWWGAYLNHNPQKKVVVPEVVHGDPHPTHTRDFYLPDWNVTPVPPFEPYPEDMYDYGETQSWDKDFWDNLGAV